MRICGGVFAALLGMMAASADAQPGGSRPFGAPEARERAVLLGEGAITTAGFETSGTLTPDGRTLYFTRGSPDFGRFFFTVMESHFANGRWSAPKIAPFSGEYADTSPFLSPDGMKLVFSSNRPVNGIAKSDRADFDLWVVERRSNGWSKPRPLTALNGRGWDMHSSMTRDGTIYFGSIRDKNYDIWRSRLAGGEWQAPERVPAPVNSKEVEYDPYVDPDGRYLIFGSDGRPDSLGGADLYVSFYRDGGWTEPRNLGPKVNTPNREAGGFVVRQDGQAYLIFNSESGRVLGTPLRPSGRLTDRRLAAILNSPENHVRNFYYINLRALGIEGLD